MRYNPNYGEPYAKCLCLNSIRFGQFESYKLDAVEGCVYNYWINDVDGVDVYLIIGPAKTLPNGIGQYSIDEDLFNKNFVNLAEYRDNKINEILNE